MKLLHHDLQWALRRAPLPLLKLMKNPAWSNKIFVGGGFLRSIVSGDEVNDVDVFCPSQLEAKRLADELKAEHRGDSVVEHRVIKTDNAYTVLGHKLTIQIIHRWSFSKCEDVTNSFDFTCCCAAFGYDNPDLCAVASAEGKGLAGVDVNKLGKQAGWYSYCDDRFYPDIASKRLVYRAPVRNEDAGGSMLRVLKYYQKGYRIPLDSLAKVIARLMSAYNIQQSEQYTRKLDEQNVGRIVCGLLREVDPNIDPSHIAHLPSEDEEFATPSKKLEVV